MCSPLPLRVWCMAAMAPALTEAATQAHIKLPLSPPSSTDCSLLNGRDKKPTIGAKEEFSSSVARSPLEKGFGKPALSGLTYLQNVNGGLAKPVVGNTSVAATGGRLVHLKVIRNLSKEPYHRNEVAAARKEGVNNSTNTRNQMNRQSSFPPRGSLAMNNINSKNSLTTTTTTTTTTTITNNTSNISSVCFSEYPQQRLQNSLSILASKLQRSHEGSSKTSALIVNNMNTNAIDKPCNESISGSGRSIEGGLDLQTAQRQVDKFQCNLEKKANTLLKRLRRIQGRQLEHHIRHQLAGFVNKQHKNLQSMAKSINSPGPSNVAVADLKTELLQSEDVRNLSTAALVNLVRKLQSSQPISIGHQRLIQNVSTKIDSNSVLKLDKATCEETERVACQLNTALRHMESSLDSDATESSSGGESADECEFGEVDTEKKPQDMPLHRRSEWKWAAERSSIASRWTWLQAQVSDLEYRIRQQSDTHRQIRSEKGDLVFESLQTQPVTSNLRTGEILNQEEKSGEKRTEKSNKPLVLQSSKFNPSLVNCVLPLGLASPMSSGKDTCQTSTQKFLNGLIDNNHSGKSVSTTHVASTVKTEDKLLENSESLATPAVPVDITCQAARCRPVKSYRKRKLFRTAGLHQLYRKATRLSTVKCHCYTPVVPCAMCGGRYNNTQSLDPDLMPLHERLSLLDPSFHPVLSFSQEIPLPIHFEALLKSGEWQNKPSPKPTKSTNERRRQKLLQNEARRTSKKLKNAAAVLLSSAKFRSRYDKKPVQKSRPPSTSPVSLTMTTPSATSSSLPTTPQNKVSDKRLCRTEIKKRRAAQLAIALKKLPSRSLSLGGGRLAGKRRFRMTSESSGLKDPSSAMNFSSYTLKEIKEATLRKRRGESAFDINNIVIPYSMAASTRVEKLQYKEIVTPKWREIGEDSSESKTETEGIDTSAKSPCTTIKEAISGKTNGIIVPAHIKEDSEDEAEANEDEDDDDDDDDELPIEDLSDELYIQRHAKCEIQEKKRFVSYFQHGRRSNRSVRLDDSDPIFHESVNLMDSNSMVGSPTHSLTSSRHGNESIHSVASQSPPLPPLLQLQVQSPSQTVTNPNVHKPPSMQSVTESRSFLASLDDTSDELKQLDNQQNVLDKSSLHRDEGDINNRQQQSLLTSCQSASGSKKSLEQTLLKSEGTENSHQMLAGYKLLPASVIHHSSKLTPPLPFPFDSYLQTRPSTPTTYSAGQLQRCNDEQIGRRRSSSVSRTDRFSYDDENMTFSHEMFEHLCVEPWVPRTFPLSEEEFEKLHVKNSSVEVQKNPSTTSPEISQAELATPGSSHPCSPLPSSSSASTTEDDPNDPEWKVIGSKSGIVLRLAKR